MRRETVKVTDEAGLHARPASELAKAAAAAKCNVNIIYGEKTINAKSVLAVMTLGAKKDSEITIECDGEDEEKTMESLVQILRN